MDYRQRTTNLIKTYYSYLKDNDISKFIRETCYYFDYIKNNELSENELQFLYFIANKVGIPQYFDMINKKHNNNLLQFKNINLLTLGSMINESNLVHNNETLHKFQLEVLNKFNPKLQNRFIFSAPTSFGKTFLIYQIIEKMKYDNILLMFPTISLLSENYEILLEKTKKVDFWKAYNLHTLSDEETKSKKNIWLLTPERFLSLIDNNGLISFDFIFIDEIYKIDNEYIIDVETKEENERDIAYRIALEFACKCSKDLLLTGPYMEIKNDTDANNSMINFILDNNFKILNFNKIEIVNKEKLIIKYGKQYEIDNIVININQKSIFSIVASIINAITTEKNNTIVYCSTKASVEKYAKEIVPYLSIIELQKVNDNLFLDFINHLENNFGKDWIVIKSLKNRIGIHHGLVPKYIQKQIIDFFNIGLLTVLISTTTITEGVNTTAKNIIIRSDKKGTKNLKHFDAMNIAGRAGRFYHHFLGRVIIVQNDFNKKYDGKEEELKHKNYDKNSQKDEIDYNITNKKYLNQDNIDALKKLNLEVDSRNILHYIIDKYKVIGISDKLIIYDSIFNFNKSDYDKINDLIMKINSSNDISWNGFQLVINTLLPIIKNAKLKFLMTKNCENVNYSVLIPMVSNYLKDGFLGTLRYNLKKEKDIDIAMRKSADLIYNVFKYQLVKYLGIFDLMYRCVKFNKFGKNFNNEICLSRLIKKLEYSVVTKNGQILNDYGVPYNLLSYYEKGDFSIKKNFDNYENYIDKKILLLLN